MGFCVRSETKLGAVVGSGCDCGEFWGRKRGCGSSALGLDEFCTSSRTHTHMPSNGKHFSSWFPTTTVMMVVECGWLLIPMQVFYGMFSPEKSSSVLFRNAIG